MKPLIIIAGKKISQIQWQGIKSHMNLGNIKEIEKARYQDKKKQSLEYENLMREIKNSETRFYSKSKILSLINPIYQTGFYQCRVELPKISQQYISEFVECLKNENPNEVYTMYIYQKQKSYQVYVFKTPHHPAPNRVYPKNTILKVIMHNNQIVDLETLCPSEEYQKTSQLFKKNQQKQKLKQLDKNLQGLAQLFKTTLDIYQN